MIRFVLAEVGPEPSLLIGHSWGAFLAQAMAARLGEQVAGLALICPVLSEECEIPEHRPVARSGGIGDHVFRGYFVMQTTATTIELTTRPTRVGYVGAPARPAGVYELVVDGEPLGRASVDGGDLLMIDMTTGGREITRGEPCTIVFEGLPARSKTVELWLPHHELTELVSLRADAPVEAAGASGRRVWLHHGSSISHGSNALTPTGTWPAIAAAAAAWTW